MFVEESSGKHRQHERMAWARIDVRDFYLSMCKKTSFVGNERGRFTLGLN